MDNAARHRVSRVTASGVCELHLEQLLELTIPHARRTVANPTGAAPPCAGMGVWFVFDACGMICAAITHSLLLYAHYVVT